MLLRLYSITVIVNLWITFNNLAALSSLNCWLKWLLFWTLQKSFIKITLLIWPIIGALIHAEKTTLWPNGIGGACCFEYGDRRFK